MARIDPREMERIAREEVPFVGQLGIRLSISRTARRGRCYR